MSDPLHNIPENFRIVIDLTSIATLLGSLVNALPSVAAALTVIWTALRIYEMDTVQRKLGKKNKEEKD